MALNPDRARLDSDPSYKRLSEGEVKALSDGALVTIIWTGGNGPHEYHVETDKYQNRRICYRDEDAGKGECVDSAFIGPEYFHTAVYIRV